VVAKANARGSSKAAKHARNSETTQTEILDAAEEEFAKHGLSGARTEMMAAQTGVTKAMIYYYFKSKERLYQAVLERAFGNFLRVTQQLELDKMSAEQALEQFVQGLLTCLALNPNLPLILCHEGTQNQGKYYKQSCAMTVYTTLSNILEQGIAQGVFRQLEPRHTAINLIGICVFYFVGQENLKHHWAGKNMLSQEMMEKHSQEAIDLILAGVRLYQQ